MTGLYPNQEQPDENERTEIDLEDAKCAEELAAKRIAELTAALQEALAYFKDNYDVVDGYNGRQLPNREMRLGQMIDETLHGIRF